MGGHDVADPIRQLRHEDAAAIADAENRSAADRTLREGAAVFKTNDAARRRQRAVAGGADRADEADFLGAGEERPDMPVTVATAHAIEGGERCGNGGEIIAAVRVNVTLRDLRRGQRPAADVANGDRGTGRASRAVTTLNGFAVASNETIVARWARPLESIISMRALSKYGSCTPPRKASSTLVRSAIERTTKAGWSRCA
jgi:hypothetical protein